MNFKPVSKYPDAEMPVRKTTHAAGYDFFVAEDTIVPPYNVLYNDIVNYMSEGIVSEDFNIIQEILDEPRTLDEVANLTKKTQAKPTLVPTGIKAELDEGTYLELSVRSSCPLKYWLILANSVGVIDGDYYNNSDNEGHIYFQMINLSPVPIMLKKGDCIGQGIIKPYLKADGDNCEGIRTGGFGSTSK